MVYCFYDVIDVQVSQHLYGWSGQQELHCVKNDLKFGVVVTIEQLKESQHHW